MVVSIATSDDVVRLITGSPIIRNTESGPAELEPCFLYGRESTDKQESIPAQLESCRDYCKRRGFIVLDSFVDKGVSGMDDDRSGYQKMLREVKKGRVKHVVAFKSCRYTRSNAEYIRLVKDLFRAGIVVHTHKGPVDPKTAFVDGWVNEAFIENLSESVINRFESMARKGELFIKLPPGYRRDAETREVNVCEPDAQYVRTAFDEFVEGVSLLEVMRRFNQRKGVRRHVRAISNMLQNPIYMGWPTLMRTSGSIVRGKGKKPPEQWIAAPVPRLQIVSVEQFARAQERFKENARNARTHDRSEGAAYPLTGIIFCERCEWGSGKPVRMQGVREYLSDGKIKTYTAYRCKECKRSRVGHHIESTVRALVGRIPIADKIEPMLREMGTRKSPLAKRAKQINEKIKGLETELTRFIRKHESEPDKYTERELLLVRTGIRDDIASLQREADTIEAAGDVQSLAQQSLEWLRQKSGWEVLDGALPAVQNDIYKRMIRRCWVDLDEGTLRIEWTAGIAHLIGEEETIENLPRKHSHQPKHPRAPRAPRPVWRSWPDALQCARDLNLPSRAAYHALFKDKGFPDGLPRNPQEVYKADWAGWRDYLGSNDRPRAGRKRSWLPFGEARARARELGLISLTAYTALAKSGGLPSGLPHSPQEVYRDEWTNWPDFLGTDNKISRGRKGKWLPWAEARTLARSLHLPNAQAYLTLYRQRALPDGLPSHVSVIYKGEWKGWVDYLGTSNRPWPAHVIGSSRATGVRRSGRGAPMPHA